MTDEHDLKVILESHFPIITIQTHEEARAVELVKRVTARTSRALYTWTITEGLTTKITSFEDVSLQSKTANTINYDTSEPDAALKSVKQTLKNSVIVLMDFHSYINEPTTLRLLKEIAQEQPTSLNSIVLISHEIEAPAEIARLCANFNLSLPDAEQIENIITTEAQTWALKNGRVKADKQSIQQLVRNLQGLTKSDVTRFVRNAIYDDGAITQNDIPAIMKAKYELLGQEGVLSFEYETARFSEVGGFKNLTQWVAQRKAAFLKEEGSPSDTPKGMLLLGVQGCGKSLAAKAVAGVWDVPLLRLDFGALYNKFFGETEKNIRDSLNTAELMSPCVLWLDEIEKGISSGDNDNGTSRRVLSSLLTWMAENKHSVFIVATANDIQSLPPELIRKGRMDEIFFVDLPQGHARQEIITIHLRKRLAKIEEFDIDALTDKCVGFSGAEIEQGIIAAIYSSHSLNTVLSTELILKEFEITQPLSVVMDEKIQTLRHWAKNRTVQVD